MTGPWADHEGYCRHCFKMVPLTITGKSLIVHYTFFMINASVDSAPKSCKGTRPDNVITFGMDDPKAAFE